MDIMLMIIKFAENVENNVDILQMRLKNQHMIRQFYAHFQIKKFVKHAPVEINAKNVWKVIILLKPDIII